MDKLQNVIWRAMKDFAEAFQRVHRDAFIVFEVIDSSWIDVVFRNEDIGRYSLFFHCSPQRRVTDHRFAPLG